MDRPDIKAKVEAALFLTENPLKAQAVARIVNEDVDLVRRIILELISDYEERKGGLEISDDNGYIIQVKDEFATLIDEFVPLDMPVAQIRTLSAIAIKQPVMQSEIIKIRGAGAYEHIKELILRDLINKREDGGRSPILTTTRKFQEYFRLSKDGKSLRHFFVKQEAEAEKEARQEEEEAGTFDATPPEEEAKAVLETIEPGESTAVDILENALPSDETNSSDRAAPPAAAEEQDETSLVAIEESGDEAEEPTESTAIPEDTVDQQTDQSALQETEQRAQPDRDSEPEDQPSGTDSPHPVSTPEAVQS